MWMNIAAKLVPSVIKAGMSILPTEEKAKELESVAELKLAEKMANGEVEFKKAVIDSHRRLGKMNFALSSSQSLCCFWHGLYLVMTLIYKQR